MTVVMSEFGIMLEFTEQKLIRHWDSDNEFTRPGGQTRLGCSKNTSETYFSYQIIT